MGKLSSQPEPTIHHFSHLHPLNLCNYNPQQTLSPASCSGCKLAVSGWIYSCQACKFFLHVKCSQMPQQIKHPFDQNHVFSLLPIPIYPEGSFNCDACGKQGNGFSYHCQDCSIDLHILCASMPLSATHNSHHHQLSLTFSSPYQNRGFSCDICKSPGSNSWLYRCSLCEFDAHLACATSKPTAAPPAQIQAPQAEIQAQIRLIQQYQSSPLTQIQPPVWPTQQYQTGPMAQFQASVQAPLMQQYQRAPMAQVQTVQMQMARTGRATPEFLPQSGGAQYMVRPPPLMQNYANFGNPGICGSVGTTGAVNSRQNSNDLLNQAIQGLVSGASQAAGQQLLQSLMGGGGGGGGGGSGGSLDLLGGGGSLDPSSLLGLGGGSFNGMDLGGLGGVDLGGLGGLDLSGLGSF